jgi:hypothetical protein
MSKLHHCPNGCLFFIGMTIFLLSENKFIPSYFIDRY